MSDGASKRRRPQIIRLNEPEQTSPQPEAPKEDKSARAPKREPKPKKPRSPRTMVAPEPEPLEEMEFESPASKGQLVHGNHLPSTKSWRWDTILLSSLTGLIFLGVGIWFTHLIESLFARNTWLGWAGSGLLALTGIALLVLLVREISALLRLRHLGDMRLKAELALEKNKGGEEVVTELRSFYRNRRDMAWQLAALAKHDGEVIDSDDRIRLAERELISPLDTEAKRLISSSAKRVSVVTVVSPVPALDVLFTGFQVLKMLRQVAGLYGGRPGSLETLKLARMVITHLAITGSMALSDTLIQNVLGHGIAGRLSAKLGEGTVNGIMTTRIGIAAMTLCRPLPFAALEAPGWREFTRELTSFDGESEPKNQQN